ncbi:putative oxidoreductase -like protein [Trichinella pseudospiralis]|uniref:Putative oxidoreductase-like protein n=1 Tax=Trichinella pseudospiralis TaxID=6337 RepID=A0A0V0XHX1_TRIPS|nr:putative oxidoreductase -like protein [Trichinella pseudospiralis]
MEEIDLDFPNLKTDLQQNISIICNTKARLNSMDVQLIHQKNGFMSKMFLAKLGWQQSELGNNELPKSLILKVTNRNQQSDIVTNIAELMQDNQFSSTFVDQSHNCEVDFYQMIHANKLTMEIFPKCYLARPVTPPTDRGILVLENLNDRAALIDDMSTSMTVGQLLSLFEATARFHAWCLTTDVDWMSMFSKYANRSNMTKNFNQVVKNGLHWFQTEKPELSGDLNQEMIVQFFEQSSMEKLLKKVRTITPVILKHGDFWTNNIFFHKQQLSGKASDQLAAIIDWQMAGPGSAMEDFVCVLAWCTSSVVRRANQRMLIDHYYDNLKNYTNGKVELPEKETFWQAYKLTFPLRGLLLPCFLNILLGNLVKTDTDDNGQMRKEEMISRAIDCYKDSVEFLSEISSDNC